MEMGGSAAVAPTDIENPLETLKMELKSLSSMSHSRCIYRVPERFRRVRPEAFSPRVISIGPFHRTKEALKPMEVHKMRYLKCFMERSHSNLDAYIEKIRDQEEELRGCYAEAIVPTGDEFVSMVLVDAIFLIEFLLRCSRWDLQDENDHIFRTPRMLPDVEADLLMLENQLPLFILEDFFSLYDPESCSSAKLLSILFLFDQDKIGFWSGMTLSGNSSPVEGRHFVDLLSNLLSMAAPPLKEECNVETSRSATAPSIEKLHLSGVKIIRGDESVPNLFDIRFDDKCIKAILKIPKFRIEDTAELILRNLIAFEQCDICYDDQFRMKRVRMICDYVMLMDMLIDSPRDVELLVTNKILQNDIGGDDKELSKMINSLCIGISFDPAHKFYYGALCAKLETFCGLRRHKWCAYLKQKYFHNPWSSISVVAAIVLLIFTAIQTFSSVHQFYSK